MKRLIAILICSVLGACTTVEFVRKDTTPEKKGILRYSPTSDSGKEAKYKAEINKKATEFCGSPYKITKEYQALTESDSSVGVGTGFGFGTQSSILVGSSGPSRTMANYVEFSCNQNQ